MKNRLRKNYNLLEVVCALAVLAVLTTAFMMSLRTLYKADREFSDETEAVLLLDNVLERVKAVEKPDEKTLRALFKEETGLSSFASRKDIETAIRKGEGGFKLLVLRKKSGRTIAEVVLKCKK